jgi:hypothetical protein
MIQIVTGKLGAGKTLYSMTRIVDDLVKGKTVCTNIAVNWPAIVALARRKYRVVLDDSQLVVVDPRNDRNWHKQIPWGLGFDFVELYLDEIHLFFNARDWQETKKVAGDMVSFLSQSRKARVNITFIVQDENTLDAQFKMQAEWVLYIVNSDHLPFGILGALPVKFFIVCKRDAENGNTLSRTCKGYDKSYFGLYDSFSFLDDKMQTLSESRPRVAALKLPRVAWWRYLWENFCHLLPKRKKCASSSLSQSSLDSASMAGMP